MRIRRNGTTTTQEEGVLIAPLESRMSSKSLQSGSEGGGGDGAARQPRRPPTLFGLGPRNRSSRVLSSE
jgi:hypothetical protein